MNLTTLVERACLEAGYNDTDDVAAAKKFARHWDEHIWNHALWKDALVTSIISFDPVNNEDHAEGIIYLPEVIDRVVAVRSTSAALNIHAQEHYYRMDYDMFAQQGEAMEFVILPPAWFKWRWSALATYLEISGAAGDATTAIRVVWQDGAGKRTVTNTTIGALEQLTPADDESITVLAVYKAVTTADVLFQSGSATAAGANLVAGSYDFSEQLSVTLTNGTAYEYIAGNEDNLKDASNNIVAAGTFTPTGLTPTSFYTLNKAGGFGVLATAIIRTPASSNQTTDGTFLAADTICPQYARIRILPIPTTAITIQVLGKGKYIPLDFDYQEPALRNLNNALLAFIRGSLKRRGEQNATAQLEFQEANTLLKNIAGLEAIQAANHVRFTPENGFGPEYGLGPTGGGTYF
jgi:hypothetical protein